MCAEAEQFNALAPERLALKVPCTLAGLALVARLSARMDCALTAIFSAAQVLLACEAGARYVIPYVNRSTRLLGDGLALVEQMSEMCERVGDRKSTRLNSSHLGISYAVFCLKKKNKSNKSESMHDNVS